MRMELKKEAHAEALASLKQFYEQNRKESLGNMEAEELLDFFLEELGPLIYNHAVADAQSRMQQAVLDLSGDLYEEEFPYWERVSQKRKRR
ncbi:MAG: hypothetical protein OHK0029_23490 [Armatimonadaceae bacterium]